MCLIKNKKIYNFVLSYSFLSFWYGSSSPPYYSFSQSALSISPSQCNGNKPSMRFMNYLDQSLSCINNNNNTQLVTCRIKNMKRLNRTVVVYNVSSGKERFVRHLSSRD